jgi:hypothetical protein
LVAIVQATRALANAARDNENQILVCIAMCILGCLESILEYFNKWVSGMILFGSTWKMQKRVSREISIYTLSGVRVCWPLRVQLYRSWQKCHDSLQEPWMGSHHCRRSHQ